jgi:hypothetical protein
MMPHNKMIEQMPKAEAISSNYFLRFLSIISIYSTHYPALLIIRFPATGVAGNRGADFVQHLAPSRRARRNKALDRTPRAAQAS